MNFDTWEPVYDAICADMGYDRAADEHARDRLAALVNGATTCSVDPAAFEGQTVAVAAPGPGLADALDAVAAADVVLAAGTAADRLLEAGRPVDWIVTDLDGHPGRVGEFTRDGCRVAVHAHGDNVALLERHVPTYDLAAVLPTTQAAPVGPVRNFGGFTDGDRAAFFADALGAEALTFPGWDLADPSVGAEKRRKLRWAARLLAWLERRRDARFAVLDGLREDLDLSAIPGMGEGPS